MECNNKVPLSDGTQSGQNEQGHLFHGGHAFNSAFNVVRPPPFWRPPPPMPSQFHGFGPRPVYPYPFRYGPPCPPLFNVPPPPVDRSSVSKSNEDKAWLSNWLQSRPFPQLTKLSDDKGLSICEAREKVKLWLKLLEDLEEKRNLLHGGFKTLNEAEWSKIYTDVGRKKADISDLSSSCFTEKALLNLQKKLSKQMRKRSRQKKQLAKQRKDAYLAQLKRQTLHEKADAWLADMQLAVDRARKDEELKEEADAVLGEVTRRQSDGRRQIALLDALQKLHQARIQAMDARGSKLAAEDKQCLEHSKLVLGRLLTLWSRKMEEYAKEEHGLRVMLEESAAKKSDLEIQKVRQILGEWKACLFGSGNSVTSDELDDINTLVSIRYAWDQYLVPDGVAVPMASTIPVGWVVPTTPSSPEWQHLLSER